MSVKRNTIRYGAAAAALAIVIIAGSVLLANSSFLASSSGIGSNQGSSTLVIQLTDPPHVPLGTSSLNLTYSSLALLVGEPAGGGQVNTNSINVTPPGGSATLDLLKLQNVSQTIGTASLPNGSVIYSVTFAVSSVSIDVNGTVSSVSLATGGSTLTFVIANHPSLAGTNLALLQLNPVVVNTPSGYSLIPSSVAVIRQSEGQGEEQFGAHHHLTNGDNQDLQQAQGSLVANLTAMSVSGKVTSITIEVNNTGSVPITLSAIGLHGNFTSDGACPSGEPIPTESTTSTTEGAHTTVTNAHTTITVNESAQTSGQAPESPQTPCSDFNHAGEVVFVPAVPVSSTTTTTTVTSTSSSGTCNTLSMNLVNSGVESDPHGLVLAPGECVKLTFSGTISFGESQSTLIPSTLSGQAYGLHIIASNEAEMMFDCVLPLGANSCTATGNI